MSTKTIIKSDKKEYSRKYYKERSIKLRRILVDTMGGECAKCGFKDIRALQIDHVKGGGEKERKERSSRTASHSLRYINRIIDSFLKGEDKYQLLCANCNWIKRVENNEYIPYNGTVL